MVIFDSVFKFEYVRVWGNFQENCWGKGHVDTCLSTEIYTHVCFYSFIQASWMPVVNAFPVRKDSRSQESPPALFSHHNLILPQSFLELSALESSNADLAWALADFLSLFALPSCTLPLN